MAELELDLKRSAEVAESASKRRHRREAVVLNTWRVIVFVIALLAWHFASLITSPLILPGPVAVGRQILESRALIMTHMWITLTEVILGFIAGSVIGIVAGTMIAHSRLLAGIFRPYIATSQAVPKAALAPLFVLWLGFELGPKVAIAALICFFPLLENTIVGLRRVDPDVLRLFVSLGARKPQTFVKLRLPNALPYIMTGLRVGIIFATVGAVVAEFITANKGLGALIIIAQANFNTRLMFAVIIILTLMGVTLYEIIGLVERRILHAFNLGEGEIENRRRDNP